MGVSDQHHAPAALPPGKTRYPLYRRLGRPQGRSGRMRKMSPPPGFFPRTVQPVASRYTDWAIPTPNTFKNVYILSYTPIGLSAVWILLIILFLLIKILLLYTNFGTIIIIQNFSLVTLLSLLNVQRVGLIRTDLQQAVHHHWTLQQTVFIFVWCTLYPVLWHAVWVSQVETWRNAVSLR